MAVAKVHAGGPELEECRHVRFVDGAAPESVRHEDDDIVLLLGDRDL